MSITGLPKHDPRKHKPIGCRVTRNAVQTLTTGTVTAVQFNAETYDHTASPFHDTVTNNTRLTMPYTGRYDIKINTSFDPHNTGRRIVRVHLDGGATIIARVDAPAVQGVSNPTSLSLAFDYEFTAAQYIEVMMFQDSGGNLDTYSAFHPVATIEYRGAA